MDGVAANQRSGHHQYHKLITLTVATTSRRSTQQILARALSYKYMPQNNTDVPGRGTCKQTPRHRTRHQPTCLYSLHWPFLTMPFLLERQACDCKPRWVRGQHQRHEQQLCITRHWCHPQSSGPPTRSWAHSSSGALPQLRRAPPSPIAGRTRPRLRFGRVPRSTTR